MHRALGEGAQGGKLDFRTCTPTHAVLEGPKYRYESRISAVRHRIGAFLWMIVAILLQVGF
jgi:hypothetical protein